MKKLQLKTLRISYRFIKKKRSLHIDWRKKLDPILDNLVQPFMDNKFDSETKGSEHRLLIHDNEDNIKYVDKFLKEVSQELVFRKDELKTLEDFFRSIQKNFKICLTKNKAGKCRLCRIKVRHLFCRL